MKICYWKKYLVNLIIVLALLCIVIFCIIYFCVNHSGINTENKTSVQMVNEENQASIAESDAAMEGFWDITVCTESYNQEGIQPIKLYVQENNCYLFIPSYWNMDKLTIHFDQDAYSLYLNGEQLFNGDVLKAQEVGELKLEISQTGAVRQYMLYMLQSQNLPTIFISTANKTMEYIHSDKDNMEPGAFLCIQADGSVDSSGILDAIKMHGNTSLVCLKKTYQLTFENDTNLLSMGSAKHWILQANAYDKSYLRNKLAYDLALQLGLQYAVEAEYADVYFNNEYAGNYLVCEKVEAGENRVDIPIPQVEKDAQLWDMAEIVDEQDRRYYEFSQEMDNAEGYLFEANNKIVSSDEGRIDTQDCYFTVESGIYEVKSPKRASRNEIEYVTGYMQKVEKLMKECDSEKTWNELKRYIDMDSFAVMYLLNILTNEVDANDYSTFYYIQMNGAQDLLYAGPAWDYDRAFGNEERNVYISLNGFPNGLCEELLKNKQFRQYVTDKFNQQMLLDSENQIMRYLEDAEEFLLDSVMMNEIRWKNDVERIHYSYNTFQDEVSYLKYYYKERLELVNIFLNKPELCHTVTFTNIMGRSKDCWILDGEEIPEDIFNFIKQQYGCSRWAYENGQVYQQGRPIFSDMVLYAAEDAND